MGAARRLTEWALRAGYGFGSRDIATGLRALAGLPEVAVEDPAHIAQALDWMSAGMDFTMHCISPGRVTAPHS